VTVTQTGLTPPPLAPPITGGPVAPAPGRCDAPSTDPPAPQLKPAGAPWSHTSQPALYNKFYQILTDFHVFINTFLRTRASIARISYGNSVLVSVCPSVRPGDTSRYRSKPR